MLEKLQELEKLLLWYNQTYTTGDTDKNGIIADDKAVEEVLRYVRADIKTEKGDSIYDNIRTAESIDTDNYYYVQVFTKQGNFYTICFADTPTTAKERINKWLDDKENTITERNIHLYHKNYKRDSRKMVAEGNYIVQ